MSSFNVYGKTEQVVGGNTPVWLGTVKPIPRGATGSAPASVKYPAGMGAIYNAETGDVTIVNDLSTGGGAMVDQINAFLYNDVYVDNPTKEEVKYTMALVQHHPEGLLIERVYPEITEEQIQTIQTKVPGVLLVRG